MNKLVTVLGVAAVATLAGCKDPNYKSYTPPTESEVKIVEPTPASETKPADVKPADVKPAETKPSVAQKPVAAPAEKKPVAPVPPEPEYTVYIVQNGDYLARISKKYNLTIGSIKRLNGLKSDTIRVGQKLKLPGKIDVGVQKTPKAAIAKKASVKKAPAKAAADYTGATKEYVVKNGDTLGSIAYGNGCNIRQLKKLNNLTSDSLRIGQKLKIPAAGKASAKTAEAQKAASPAKPAEAEVVQPSVDTSVPAQPEEIPEGAAPAKDGTAPATAAAVPEAANPAPAAKPAEAATMTYTVQEGDDMTGVSIRWGVTAAAIRELNNLAEDAQLTVGQVIKLPADAQQ